MTEKIRSIWNSDPVIHFFVISARNFIAPAIWLKHLRSLNKAGGKDRVGFRSSFYIAWTYLYTFILTSFCWHLLQCKGPQQSNTALNRRSNSSSSKFNRYFIILFYISRNWQVHFLFFLSLVVKVLKFFKIDINDKSSCYLSPLGDKQALVAFQIVMCWLFELSRIFFFK